MTKVMVSGIQSSKEAMWVLNEKIAYAGLVLFSEENKDYIKMENAYGILRVLQAAGRENAPRSVAVTRDPSIEQIAMIQKFGFDYIQVYGKLEKAAYDMIRIPIIRAMDEEHLSAMDSYLENENVAAVLFDVSTYIKKKNIEWKFLEEYVHKIKTHDKLCILTCDADGKKIKEMIEKLCPDIVDVNVGTDTDEESIHGLIEEIK